MDVHVHKTVGQRDIEHAPGKLADHGGIFVCLLERGLQSARADGAAVAEKVLRAAVAAAVTGRGNEALYRDAVAFGLHRQQSRRGVAPEQRVYGALRRAVAGGEKFLLPVAQAAKAHVRAAERRAQRALHARGALAPVGAEKLLPRGGVVEKIAHGDRRTLRAAGLLHGDDLPGLHLHAHAHGSAAAACRERDTRNGADRRESFAAKAERADGLEPALVRELARRVAQKAHTRVLRRHADAVVRDADIVPPSGAELKHDGARSGVHRVFQKLLDRRGGALNDLARGDKVGDVRRKDVDDRHDICTSRIGIDNISF